MGDIFYNKTVTVYNKVSSGVMGRETWYPTLLENVRLLVTKGSNIAKSGLESADTAKLFVKTDNLSKQYLKPLSWQKTDDKEQYFTFTNGNDFFVEGDTREEQILEEDFYNHMKAKYDNCFLVNNVDEYYLIPHLEVGGK